MDILWNEKISIPLDQWAKQSTVAQIIKNWQWISIPYDKQQVATIKRTEKIINYVQESTRNTNSEINLTTQEKIMQDIYSTLSSSHIDSDKINLKDLEYWAIKWMVESVWDKYTIFFKPDEATNFKDTIEWEFEWIWVTLEMQQWQVIIVSVIDNSPAEKSWLKAGDVIIQVDDTKITDDTSFTEIATIIKWPKWTTVKLLIKRWESQIEKIVKRNKIIVWPIEQDSDLWIWNCYIKINIFSTDLAETFATKFQELENYQCKKYIIDLRNNPWWDLWEVNTLLSYFIPTGETNVIIKSKRKTEKLKSKDLKLKISDKEIIILVNWGSASASEIFAGTMKEYDSNKVVLIWEKTFWKGSVQEIIDYTDWSSLKYTFAKRYTGKNWINVNNTWITPDIIIEDNTNTEKDEQLETAKNYQFPR